jgi:hypothetical protein
MRSSLLVSQLVHQHAWVLDPSIRKQISLNAFSAAMGNQLMSGAGGVNGIFDKRGQYSIYKSSSPIVIPVSAQDNDLGSQNDADNPLLGCVKEHFGLMAGTTTLAVAGMPISKKMLGHPVVERSSQYTNLTSHFGNKFFPRKVLASPTLLSTLAKRTTGTIRVFGIIGRVSPIMAIGFAIYDIYSLYKCMSAAPFLKEKG